MREGEGNKKRSVCEEHGENAGGVAYLCVGIKKTQKQEKHAASKQEEAWETCDVDALALRTESGLLKCQNWHSLLGPPPSVQEEGRLPQLSYR